MIVLGAILMLATNPVRPVLADEAEEAAEDETANGESGLYLPGDRQRQRQLDRAIRLVEDRRWTDAAMLLDEILAAETDSFHIDRRDVDRRNRPASNQPENRQPENRGENREPDAGPRPGGDADLGTLKSLKAVASDVIERLHPDGREAYELQFRLRAERALEQAVSDADLSAVMAVARRWFHTPAGGKAAMLLAAEALEGGQPLASVAWLDRLRRSGHAAAYEPTLSVMRAIARRRLGDNPSAVAALEEARKARRTDLRIAGRDATVAYPSGGGEAWLSQADAAAPSRDSLHASEWLMHGGSPARNAAFDAFRPLLSPRYRVSLARHPEEARAVDRHRAAMADQNLPLIPAAQPLAVAGRVIVRSSLGLLAVDFQTGKRIWMQSGAFGPFDDASLVEEQVGGESQRADTRGFEDATVGTLSSDGRLVFAVENPRQAYAVGDVQQFGFRNPQNPMQSGGANALSAYEVEGGGRLVWRLSSQRQAVEQGEPGGEPGQAADRQHDGWFTGPPLPVAGQLFALVESKGGIRLDVLDGGSGDVLWTQPLAELDESRAIDKLSGRERRFAGLSPSLSDGVLVCPTGAGALVGVDLSTRTLLWAYRYPSVPTDTMLNGGVFGQNAGGGGVFIRRGPNGVIVVQGPSAAIPAKARWLDGTPIIADGKALITPRDSGELHCLDLRSGRLIWKVPRKNGLYVAGVVDGRVAVVGTHAVEAVSLETGAQAWKEPLPLGRASPSGRGCISRGRLLLPTDAPEVVEIDLARGVIVGRSAGRGGAGALPGNLVAYRGEVISQTAVSLDVFHQAEPLEKAVETALSHNAADPWALYWRGQTLLDRGRMGDAIAAVRASHEADPKRIPAGMVSDAILFALERDFPAAAPLWSQAASLADDPSKKVAVLRSAVDGFLKAHDPTNAWAAFRQLADEPSAVGGQPVVDHGEPAVASTIDRWLRGRLRQIVAEAGAVNPPLNEILRSVDEVTREKLEKAVMSVEPLAAVSTFLDRFDVSLPASVDGNGASAAVAARRLLCERLGGSAAAGQAGGTSVRRELMLLSMLRADDASIRDLASGFLPPPSEVRGGRADEFWPLGRVVAKREDRHGRDGMGRGGPNGQNNRFVRLVPVPCEADAGPTAPGLSIDDLRLAYDVQNGNAVIATDGLGRRIGDPLPFEQGMPMFGAAQASQFEATLVGRVAIVRCGGTVSAFELLPVAAVGMARAAGTRMNRRLWSMTGTHGVVVGNAAMGNARGGAANGIRRNGGMPLGMRVVEPAGEIQGMTGIRLGRATTAGVPMLLNQSLEVRDVLSGGVLWARHRVPSACDLLGDDDYLTIVPRDGRGATVLSMVDGREVRRCDLPPRERRVVASGRRLVTIEQTTADDPATVPGRVRLSLVDPVSGRAEAIGEFPADARATPVGRDELAVLDGRGRLTLIRLSDASTVFSRQLDRMPAGLEGLHVLPWDDRLIVLAARQETAEERQEIDRLGTITSLPQGWGAEESNPIMTASIWSIDRRTGESLWPRPATVLRHGLQVGQPMGLPVIVFARQIHSRRGDDRGRLGLLCLDKRTGHEVHADDRLQLDHNMLSTCEVGGDPAGHRILLEIGSERISLNFDGSSIPPRPPYQATGGGAGGSDVWSAMEQIMQQILPKVLPQ